MKMVKGKEKRKLAGFVLAIIAAAFGILNNIFSFMSTFQNRAFRTRLFRMGMEKQLMIETFGKRSFVFDITSAISLLLLSILMIMAIFWINKKQKKKKQKMAGLFLLWVGGIMIAYVFLCFILFSANFFTYVGSFWLVGILAVVSGALVIRNKK